MKQHITIEQLQTLSEPAQEKLQSWFESTIPYDDTFVHVFIPQEQDGPYHGEFRGKWEREYEFVYPERYIGKLKNHQGTILPLLTIGQMMPFLEDHQYRAVPPQELCDALWNDVKATLEQQAGSE